MEIILPLPPTVNALYGGGSKQRRFKTIKYKKWLASCPKLKPRNIKHKMFIFYEIYFPDKRRRDISNYIKAAEDYLVNQGVIEDDNFNHITGFCVKFMGICKHEPRIEIYIKKAPEET